MSPGSSDPSENQDDPSGDPANWTWRVDRLMPGPSVLVDVDGVIADGNHRQGFLRGGRRDWKGFFAAAVDDVPVEGSQELLASFDRGLVVVLLTARPHTLHQITLDWLAANGFRWDLLVMRGRSHSGVASVEFKRAALGDIRRAGFEPTVAFDDDIRNVEMLRDEGVAAYYVHSGYYDS